MSHLTDDEFALCMRVRTMCTANQLRRATRGITQLYDEGMAAGELKVTQLPILVALATAGDMSISALAGALHVDRTTLTRNLAVLVDRELVDMKPGEKDARRRIASLTQEGATVLVAALEHWEVVQRAVENGFGQERLENLFGELRALSDAAAA